MKNEQPLPAPYLMRVLAFLFDWILGFLLFVFLAKQIVASHHAEGWSLLMAWTENFVGEYEKMLKAALPAAEMSARIQQLVKTAETLPSSVTEMRDSIFIIQLLFFTAYFFVLDYFLQGASPGKRILHLRTVNIVDSSPPGFGSALLRALMKTFFFGSGHLYGLILGARDAIVPLFNLIRVSWHDRLTNTIVIDLRYADTGDAESDNDDEDEDEGGEPLEEPNE